VVVPVTSQTDVSTTCLSISGDPENNDNRNFFFFALPKKEILVSGSVSAVSVASTPVATCAGVLESLRCTASALLVHLGNKKLIYS
jgi:hypothetical protein